MHVQPLQNGKTLAAPQCRSKHIRVQAKPDAAASSKRWERPAKTSGCVEYELKGDNNCAQSVTVLRGSGAVFVGKKRQQAGVCSAQTCREGNHEDRRRQHRDDAAFRQAKMRHNQTTEQHKRQPETKKQSMRATKHFTFL